MRWRVTFTVWTAREVINAEMGKGSMLYLIQFVEEQSVCVKM